MDTEALAIIVPGAVAIVATLSAWHQHYRGLKHARKLADLDNLRSILDEIAIALHETEYDLEDVRSYLAQYEGAKFFKTEDGTRVYKALGHDRKEVAALLQRLLLRLPIFDSALVAANEAYEALADIWRLAGRLRDMPEGNDSTKDEAKITRSRAAFAEAKVNFLLRAHFAVKTQGLSQPSVDEFGERQPL